MSNGLSLSKLQSFLNHKGYLIHNVFTQENYCFLIEVKSKSAAGNFMIYIPSKYNIPARTSSSFNNNTFELKFKEVGDNNDDEDDDDDEVAEEIYEKLDVSNENPESALDNAYKKTIATQKVSKKEIMKMINRQLKRLRTCIENSKFKLAISSNNIVGLIRRDDSVEVYEAGGFPRDESGFRLFVVVDLDTLYETRNSTVLDSEIGKLHAGVYNVMDKSREALMKYFAKVVSSIPEALGKLEEVYDRKTKYDFYTNYFQNALEELRQVETRNFQELDKILHNTKSDTSFRSIQEDMSTAHRRKKLEDERNLILTTKTNIYDVSSSVHSEMDNFVLAIDNYMFESVKLLNIVSKNLEQLQSL